MATTTPVASLTNATTGTGSTVDFTTAKTNVTAVMGMTGDITGGAVAVEASLDGLTWVLVDVLHAALYPGKVCAHNFSGGAYRYWRANILINITGGGAVSVLLAEAG